MQRLALHAAPAFGNAHAAPHPPQCCNDDVVLVSHPFAATPSQSARPERQTEHVPSEPHPRPLPAGQSLSAQHVRHAEPQHTRPRVEQAER